MKVAREVDVDEAHCDEELQLADHAEKLLSRGSNQNSQQQVGLHESFNGSRKTHGRRREGGDLPGIQLLGHRKAGGSLRASSAVLRNHVVFLESLARRLRHKHLTVE